MRTRLCAIALLLQAGTAGPAWEQIQPQAAGSSSPASYILGPNDQITVEVVELPEFSSKSYRIDADGSVSLPLVGRVDVAGLTMAQFESKLRTKVQLQVKNPHLVLGLAETRSRPVSVMGSVNTPGIQQLQGSATLFDVLANAGGLKQDAGATIKITRQAQEGELPVPGSVDDPGTGRHVAELNSRDVVDLRAANSNIVMRPHDEISVPRAPVLYVMGNVRKAGGFTLSQRHSLSALEALALAEGYSPNASPKHARILRAPAAGQTSRVQIPIDLKKTVSGKAEDIQLGPDDILFVPDSSSMRRASFKAAEVALQTVSGVIIWRGL
jgi:polysaccharide export outer membrane protein